MRFHIGAALIVIYLAHICDFSSVNNCILYLTIGSVIALECVNTAIEKVCDMVCMGEKNLMIKRAKDTSAGAVLIMAMASVFVGIKLFINKNSLTKIYDYFSEKPIMLAVMIIFITLWAIWVFMTDKKDKE